MATAFVGSLSRFFADQPQDAERLRPGVEAWRVDLRSGVADKVAAQLDWDEASTDAQTFDLGAHGWPGARLFAFCADRSDIEFPDEVPPLLELLPEWRTAADEKFPRSHYGQLLACDLWLPGEFPVTIRAPRPDGVEAEIGSLTVLRDQLQWLNQRTFQADREVIAAWADGDRVTTEFVAAAQLGFAALLAACELAVDRRLPLVVRADS